LRRYWRLRRKDFVKWDRRFIFYFWRDRPFAGIQDGFPGRVILSRIAGFETPDEVEGGIAGEVGKGLRDPLHRVLTGGGLNYKVKGVYRVVEHAGFRGPEAAHTPAGGGHLAGGEKFKAVLRAELVDVLLNEFVEFFPGLSFQHHAIGIKAVSATIAGGAQLSFGCFGAAGEGPVGS